ncbi:MAG: hypothetical protein ACKOW8_03065 [Flavobacteriales bacterium]|jgi:hypothetical protein
MQNEKANRLSATTQLIIAACVIYTIGLAVLIFGQIQMPGFLWFLPLIYLALSIITLKLLTGGAQRSPHRFILSVNLSVLLKLITSASICAVYFALKLPEQITFTIAVMFNYVIFTTVLMKSALKSVSNG